MLVNAAGVIATGALEATTDEVVGRDDGSQPARAVPVDARRGAAPRRRARARVVNVSSVNGLRSFPGVLAYCVSKAGVDHLTRCAALEMAPLGVRVNAVNPA